MKKIFKQIKSNKLVTALLVWNLFDVILHVAINMAEPWRIAGNVVGIIAAILVFTKFSKRNLQYVLFGSAVLVLILNAVHVNLHGYLLPSLIFIGVTVFLLLRLTQVKRQDDSNKSFVTKWWAALVVTLVAIFTLTFVGDQANFLQNSVINQTFDGRLENADYWSDEPNILSAGMGFEGIIGIPEINEEEVLNVGGSWYGSLTCKNGEEPPSSARTSAPTISSIESTGKGTGQGLDGLPVVFSWPVATETVDASDFKFTLNTGEEMFADIVTMFPNWELNERNTVVFFADFGNRIPSNQEGSRFVTKLDIVEDSTPLVLVGPNGEEISAVGLSWETDSSPYDLGPTLVGAKLNTIEDTVGGESGSQILEGGLDVFPNDELSLYEEGNYKIRVLTTGGFSPDGVTGVRPDMYEDFFRIHAINDNGETVLIEKVGEEYEVTGGKLRVVGLSDLGKKENPEDGIYYDDCYGEDRDNYIDIILVGDEAAARNITFVEIPSLEEGYNAFYNPGGPGPEPFEGVTYTAPGPRDLEPVINDLDNQMRVSREASK